MAVSSAGSQVLLGRGQVTSQDVLQAPGCSTFGPFLLNAFVVFFPQFDHSRYEILDQPMHTGASKKEAGRSYRRLDPEVD